MKQRAHTLVEVMFAIFMVAALATIVTATMPVANNARARADLLNRATTVAQRQLESARGLGYANATVSQLLANGLIDSATAVDTNTYSFTNVETTALDNVSRVLPQGTGTIRLEQVDLDLRRITVTVTWVERGRTRSVAIGTLVANL